MLLVCLPLLVACLRKARPSSEAEPVASRESTPAARTAEPEPIEIPSGPERPDEASPRRIEHSWMSLREWRNRHERQLKHARRPNARLVVIGNSIVEGWCQSAAFEAAFGSYEPLSLGVGGDQTQHVLWRIDQGALDGLKPDVAMILIGVNNLGNGFSPEETRSGIERVLERTREKLPSTPVLLLAVLPSGQSPTDDFRAKIEATNVGLAALSVPERVAVADVGSVLLQPDGSISRDVMGDFLHPTAAGYGRLSEAVKPLVESLSHR
jgi:lysophospholipase L1-like esterase